VGNLSFSAWSQDYWHSQSSDKTLHAGFYSAWKGLSWGLGYYYTRSTGHDTPDRSWSFNVNIPLGGALANSAVSYTSSSANRGYTSHQAAMYGSVPENPNLYYSVQQGYARQGQGSNSGASLDYHGGYGQAQLGYRRDRDSSQLTWGASGSIVVHPHGITLGQNLGDSFAIVRAPGAANVAVQNGSNVHTDWRGYAVVPTLTAYHKNVITLDTESMTSDTDVEQFGATVIPGGGAVVEANYQTHIGHRVLFTLHDKQGPVPFGASAQLAGDNTAATGMVADGGTVYLSGIPDDGILEVNWDDDGVAHRCTLPFHITGDQQDAVKRIYAACLSPGGN